jgi:hypothetical protein
MPNSIARPGSGTALAVMVNAGRFVVVAKLRELNTALTCESAANKSKVAWLPKEMSLRRPDPMDENV